MNKFNLFLAASPTEIISALACISEIKPGNPVIFVERNTTHSQTAIDNLVAGAASRFPEVSFRLFALERESLSWGPPGWWRWKSRFRYIKELRNRVDSAVQSAFGTSLEKLEEKIECIHFNILNDYVLILLEACRQCPRVLYPHGFDQPRRDVILGAPFLFEPRELFTAIRHVFHNKKISKSALISTVYRLCGKIGTCEPYSGTDCVYTFRQTPLKIATRLVCLDKLKETFQALIAIPPWRGMLDEAGQTISLQSVVLLLSEYNRNPIWEENSHWAEAHLSISRATLHKTGNKSLVIKAHPRSDGTAAAYLHDYIRKALPGVTIHKLPETLSALPIEALALGLKFSAACSIGSCSLPGDIGIDVPHYASPTIGEYFDRGWVGIPFWAKYEDGSRMLIAEGICQNIDDPSCT